MLSRATIMGNALALIVVVVCALLGFISLEVSSISFLAATYSLWLVVMLLSVFIKPPRDAPFCQLLSPAEIDVYRSYHLHFFFGGAAALLSAFLNFLRVAGLVWAGLCFWNGLYWLGGGIVIYFFVTGGPIAMLDPIRYMGAGASDGNAMAMEQLSLIDAVRAKQETYNSASEE